MARQTEPDIETALTWWDELPNKWTPIGWREHRFRFNVLFNGTILADPCLSPRGEQWKGQGAQLSFVGPELRQDNGCFTQGWRDCPAPALWTEWYHEGFQLRQTAFAHAGHDPSLYAWIRLEIAATCPPIPTDQTCRIFVTINAPHVNVNMSLRNNLKYDDHHAAYPRQLHLSGCTLLEPDGRTRLAIVPGSDCSAAFDPDRSRLAIDLPGKPGARVDLLLPMLPTDAAAFDAELALGYESALAQANRFWSEKPFTAAVFDCPEKYINQAIIRSLQITQITTEPTASDALALLTGSLNYQGIWATPAAMTIVLFLDQMGCHDHSRRCLELFKPAQGQVKPPSDHIPPHPGYLASPREYKSIDWLTDHGAILWAICEHIAMSGEPADAWLPTILPACEFIRDARAIKGHGGVEGIMPPAVNTDMKVATQSVWSDGWNYLGLASAVRLLKSIGHPSAAQFDREATAYKRTFLKAFRSRAAEMPTWAAPDGTTHPLVPTALSGDNPRDYRIFYLDTGPLFLVFSGLMNARDPLMKSALRWFREGPQTKWGRHDGGPWQMPFLDLEQSSCEPGYSWNAYHSHQLGDRSRYLQAMYSMFAGAMSRQTYTICETRGGITGLCNCLPCFPMARLAVLDDQIEPGSLHLLRVAPLAWLRPARETRLENMPTEFGPVTFSFRLDESGSGLLVNFQASYRTQPKRVVLHIPPVRGLKRVVVNGCELEGFCGRAARAGLVLRFPES